MKVFVLERASTLKLKERIHAIWRVITLVRLYFMLIFCCRYCIPMDEYHRAITKAEERFFSECDTSSGTMITNILDRVADNVFVPVPVIAVFTKFDALWDDAYEQLKGSGLSRKESSTKAPEHAKAMFAKAKIWDRLLKNRYPPKGHVYLAGEWTTHFVWISFSCMNYRNGEG